MSPSLISIGIVLMCLRIADSTLCRADCMVFGVELMSFSLSPRDKCTEIGDDHECPYLEGVVLPLHNSVREDVASGRDGWPSAADMRLILWDTDLEILAKEVLALAISTSCDLSPKECFWTVSGDQIQNYGLLGRSGQPPDAYDVAATWMYLNASEPFDDVLREKFYRVVRAETSRMGCADAVFTERGISARFLLCFYGPGFDTGVGNIYKTGDPCSDCPVGTGCNKTSEYPSLCAKMDDVSEPAIPQSAVSATFAPSLWTLCSLLALLQINPRGKT